MSLRISPEYQRLNAALHESNPAYGTSGGKWAGEVHRLALTIGARSVLDYGSGKGTLTMALRSLAPNYALHEFDPAIPGKDVPPVRADLVVCGDVLEHIEPDCLTAVLDDIRQLAKRAVFLVIATQPAMKTLADGRNAHLIVEPSGWWLPKIIDRWRLVAFTDMGGEFMCVGETRP